MAKTCTDKPKPDLVSQQDLEQLEGLLSKEIIKSPKHYTDGRDIEPIDVIEDWKLSHHLGCAIKYIARAGRKNDEAEDLLKAIWYLRRRMDIVNLV